MGPEGLVLTVEFMVTVLGGTYAPPWERDSATHIVSLEAGPAFGFLVHPRWISKCYHTKSRVPEGTYELAYWQTAQRCGTSTRLGTVMLFEVELPWFHAVEVELSDHITVLDGTLGRALKGEGYPLRQSAHWKYAQSMLGGTMFWGHLIRELNWRARRLYLLVMAGRATGPVEFEALPDDVMRLVIQFL